MRRLAWTVAILAVVAVPQAHAKEGVVAHLENPSVLRARPDTMISLVWTLRAGAQPFSALGIYVRLHGSSGTTSAYATELTTGRFRARLRIPPGGVRSIAIGLRGWTTGSSGSHRADMFFPIANDPTR